MNANLETLILEIGPYRVSTLITGGAWKENCYLVRHMPSGQQALIDPGDDAPALEQAVLAGGGQLNYVLLTHGHFDHVGAVAALARCFGLACRVHQGDARLLRHAPLYALRFAGKQIEPPAPSEPFDGRASFPLGEASLCAIPVPGHTMGSVAYCLDDCLFTGDTLLCEHIGRTDMPGGDAVTLLVSVRELLACMPDETRLLPGHGQPWTLGEARSWWQAVSAAPPQYKRLEG